MFLTVRYVFLLSYCAMIGLGVALIATGVATWEQVKYPIIVGSGGWIGSTIHLIIVKRKSANGG